MLTPELALVYELWAGSLKGGGLGGALNSTNKNKLVHSIVKHPTLSLF